MLLMEAPLWPPRAGRGDGPTLLTAAGAGEAAVASQAEVTLVCV